MITMYLVTKSYLSKVWIANCPLSPSKLKSVLDSPFGVSKANKPLHPHQLEKIRVGKKGNMIEEKEKKITSSTPVIIAILNGNSYFGKEYITNHRRLLRKGKQRKREKKQYRQ